MGRSAARLRTRVFQFLLLTLLGFVTLGQAGCGSDSASDSDPASLSQRAGTTSPRNPLADADSETAAQERPNAALQDRSAVIDRVDQLSTAGQYAEASSILRRLLVADPTDVEVLFRLANITAASGNLRAAVDLLDDIPEEHPQAGLAALGQSADWCFELEQYAEAERRYRRILERVPQAVPAHRKLAFMYNRQGRRQEAAQHIRELCRLGDARQDELHSLILLMDPMYDDPSKLNGASPGATLYLPIGPLAIARKKFSERKYGEAMEALRESVISGDASPAAIALFGRSAAEAQDDASYQWWLTKTDEQSREFGDYWAAIGTFELSQLRFQSAARALAEALDRDPTDYLSMGRLRQTLLALGDEEAAERWAIRWLDTRKSHDAKNRIAESDGGESDPDAIAELAATLITLDRPLEAVFWKYIEGRYRGLPASELEAFNEQRQRLVADGRGFPSQPSRLCGIELSDYPLPELQHEPVAAAPPERVEDGGTGTVPASFVNVAPERGLAHTYEIAARPQSKRYSIYQTIGGGVAVLDFDLDGRADLYFAQGGSDPPEMRGQQSNQLFRNLIRSSAPNDGSWLDVTEQSSTVEYQYGIGVTAGDCNQDGFTDLLVANVGRDVLFLNHGDGTFSRRELSGSENMTRVPSSLAVADVTGDHLPDLIQTTYIDDPDLHVKPPVDEEGRVTAPVSPGDFDAGADKLWINDGRGSFEPRSISDDPGDDSRGLGVVITDFNGEAGNEIFVGNDLYPNQLWIRDPEQGTWSDVAPLLGCAFGHTGEATGSMGIAVGDFDLSGTADIQIANYENQNASLFMSARGTYQDRNVSFQLAEPTHLLVGFGTQTLDYDNNGRLDLVVTNGHLDDTLANVSDFKQPPQLLVNLPGRFEPARVDDPSGYFAGGYLGRGLARLDFNRDGRNDFVVTHIGGPSALLCNQTVSQNHWVQLRLVGTVSERDAIGARVRVRTGGRTLTEWVTAGDGYLSRNETVVSFGLGGSGLVDELVIDWPSGTSQTHHGVAADSRWLIVEKDPKPFRID